MFKHKKIVTILVLTAMLLTLLPAAGFAETSETTGAAAEIVDNNTATEDVTPDPTEGEITDATDTADHSDQENTDITDQEDADDSANDEITTDDTVTEGSENAQDEAVKDEIAGNALENDMAFAGASAVLGANVEKAKTYCLDVEHQLLDDDGNLINVRFTTEQVPAGAILNPQELSIHEKDWELSPDNVIVYMPPQNFKLILKYNMLDPVYSQKADGSAIYNVNGLPAYCYNRLLAGPLDGIPYHKGVKYAGQENQNTDLVLAVLLAGYPYDAFGLRAQYHITSDFAAETYTQMALWAILNNEQINEESDDDYYCALIKKAHEIAGKPYNPGELHLSTESEKLNFVEQKDGSFATEAVTLYGYDGTFSLTLPDGIQIYDATTNAIIVSDENLTTHHRLIFKSAAEPDTTQSISAHYTYRYPSNIWYYEAFSNGLYDAVNNGAPPKPNTPYYGTTQYQNLLAFEDTEGTIETSFPITVTIKSTPLEPSVPTPVDPVDPDNNGGGGDYTPDTPDSPTVPDTPNTPLEPSKPAETIIPDESTPLAPAPEIAPEPEAEVEVTLDEEPVPLAQTAPISDNPKTGHSVNVIFIIQVCLLLAAAALLLNDLRQYKKAQ